MKICIMKKTLSDYSGSVTIEKGKLCIVKADRIETLNGKTVIQNRQHDYIPEHINGTDYGTTKETLRNYYKPCKFTCSDDEVLIMQLETDYHTYYAVGQNPHEMYKKIVRMYNGFSGQKYHTGNFHTASYDYDMRLAEMYEISVYRVKTDLFYWHDESSVYSDINDKNGGIYCGNYWNLYTEDNPKVFPNKSMK